ncbi:transposase [Accumulibacter sp.]|uniref:IS66 family transposase n=1 Tax=Accumulibacter sp. TaxID=2053492 RepID=UPI002C87AFA6|nr:transposase [Accumulibacter sp.]HPU80457.1 transposase [Accumulibacter sp.]
MADAAAKRATRSAPEDTEQAPPADGLRSSTKKGSGRRPGKPPGSPGHGRSQKLAVTTRGEHRSEFCAACAAALSTDAASQADTAWDEVQHLCEAHQMDPHSVLRGVVREFLYDWHVILRPVAEPHLPLSNNAAEQALRHWVISRYISHGTRSEEGSRAFAFLASLIETCRRRGASAWQYLGTVIAAARKGLQLPTIPAIPATV